MRLKTLEDRLLVEACERFLHKREKSSDIALWLSGQLREKVSREEVYPLIQEAMERSFFQLVPPVEEGLRQRIADRFLDGNKQGVHVVNVTRDSARELLPVYAAQLIQTRIHQLGGKSRVRLGLGGGGTMMRVSNVLAARLRSDENLPKLGLHAVSSGFSALRPRTAPITFLGSFDGVPTDIEYVGLFAPAIVATSEYDKWKQQAGIRESFDYVDRIKIIVTSLANAADEHGELNRFMSLSAETQADRDALQAAGWVGDLQYHPYSKRGPITEVTRYRALSLFDLDGLADLAQKRDRSVVVVAGPCGECRTLKSASVLPLLQSDRLRVWSDLVLDVDSAREVLRLGGEGS